MFNRDYFSIRFFDKGFFPEDDIAPEPVAVPTKSGKHVASWGYRKHILTLDSELPLEIELPVNRSDDGLVMALFALALSEIQEA